METAGETLSPTQEAVALLESMPPADSEENTIERLQILEQAKRKLAAAQAESTHALVTQRDAAEAEDGIPKSKRLGGGGAEVGMDRGESPVDGAALTDMATALCAVLLKNLQRMAQ